LSPPEGVKRRSVATYYYTNRFAQLDREARISSRFIEESVDEKARRWGRLLTPPIVWDWLAKQARKR
jgi:hypothetical protein